MYCTNIDLQERKKKSGLFYESNIENQRIVITLVVVAKSEHNIDTPHEMDINCN